eukprot:9422648-Heterocapsa_arctica.AAC.1
MGKGQSKIPPCKWHEDGIGCTKIDIQDREGRGMPYRHGSSKNRGEHKQSTLMVQTRERNKNKQIGYIMFEDLGTKDDASRSQAETHVYCMENKHPDKHTTKVNDKYRTERYRLHEPKTDKRNIDCRIMNLLTCKLHEGRTRITKSEIQNRDRRDMTYGHGSST